MLIRVRSSPLWKLFNKKINKFIVIIILRAEAKEKIIMFKNAFINKRDTWWGRKT